MLRRTLLISAALLCAWAWPSAARPAKERTPSPLADSMRKVRKTPSPAARQAFREFSRRNGGRWKVRYNPRTALPEAITGGRTPRYTGTPEQAAAAFFTDNKELLKTDPASLRLVLKREFMGVTHLQYQQYKDGIPVEFSYARVHISPSGEVSGYQGRIEPELPANTTPLISEQGAAIAAAASYGAPLRVSRAELVIYPDEASGRLRLAWKIRGRARGLWVYYIDATDGSVLYRYDDLRYFCNGTAYTTYGTSSGTVYAVSPLPGYTSSALGSLDVQEYLWDSPVSASLRDQYVWVGGVSSVTVTNSYGDYCAQQDGKVFSSLKGPYFSVTNYRGASAHFDNGTGVWLTKPTPLSTPHPYANSTSYSYSATINDSDWNGVYASGAFAKVMPRFTALNAGAMDAYGSVTDEDTVQVKNGNSVAGAYIGSRSSSFFGASVENPTFSVALQSDPSGTGDGFTVDISSYLVLTAAPGTHNNTNGAILWSTHTASVNSGGSVSSVYTDVSLGGANGLSEANAFYHLNAVHRYFDGINIDHYNGGLPAADLSAQVPVMVHASGDPDSLGGCGGGCNGMLNGFYDLEKGHIMLGDGFIDYHGKYRSFALDGTIVRHEYMHLVVDRIYPIINFGEFGAISEGLADFFSLASFWREGYTSQVTLGNFVGAGEGSARDISGSGNPTGARTFPADWYGEVHEDGLLLSQSLYQLGNPNAAATYLGAFSAGSFNGRTRAEVLAFAALFYFPDDFANYYDAMIDACTQMDAKWPGQCDSTVRGKITSAFSTHGIGTSAGGDAYETSGSSGLCDSNNGPECATDAGSLSSLSATVYPLGDVDYYSLPLAAGAFSAKMSLPMSSTDGLYYAYAMFLFDADRNYVADAVPDAYGTGSNVCNDSGQCYTVSPSVTLNYTVPYGGGRYYLVVSGAPNQYYGNSEANSTSDYTLSFSRKEEGTATARIYAALYDNDEISFDVPYPYFPAQGSLSSSTFSGANLGGYDPGSELIFEYAQLRDHNSKPIDLTKTNVSGSYMSVSGPVNQASGNQDVLGRTLISSRVRLQPGFAARYPGVGTVYLEVFGRNHLGQVVSLGVSNPLNLTANRNEVTAYNNIISAGSTAIIKYETLSAGDLSIKVYTQAGSLVKTVFDGSIPAGRGSVEWDGTNSNGGKAASGIYFVRAKGAGLDKVVKIAVIR